MKRREADAGSHEIDESDRDGIDEEQTDDLEHAEQVEHITQELRQLYPLALQQTILLHPRKDVKLDGLCSSGGAHDLLDEHILRFFDLLTSDNLLQNIVILEDELAGALLTVDNSLHLVQLPIYGHLLLLGIGVQDRGSAPLRGDPLREGCLRLDLIYASSTFQLHV